MSITSVLNRLRAVFAGLALGFAALVFAPAALAGPDPEIETAKRAGVIGENYEGYLEIRGAVSDGVRRKVQDINNQRRAVYEDIAEETGVSVAYVASETARKQFDRLDEGEVFRTESGEWKQK
jgi:uncharacterized protein